MNPNSEILKEAVRRIIEVANPTSIILFGSAARGEMKPDSDIDLLVVVSGDADRRKILRSVYRNMIGFDFAVDVVIATEDILKKHRDNFSLVYYAALKEGKKIYAA